MPLPWTVVGSARACQLWGHALAHKRIISAGPRTLSPARSPHSPQRMRCFRLLPPAPPSPSRADTRRWERGAVQRQGPQRCGGRQYTGESRPGESGLAPGATRLGGTPAALSHVPLGPAERAQIPHCKERNQPCGLSRPRAPGLCGGPRRPSAAPSAPALPSPLFLRAGFAESGPVGLGPPSCLRCGETYLA